MKRLTGFIISVSLLGCSSKSDTPTVNKTTPSANSWESEMNPFRVAAECYILREIGALDAAAEKKLMKSMEGSPYKDANEALDGFAGEESVAEDQDEWIAQEWAERKAKDPQADPKDFAKEVAPGVFPELGL